MNSSQVKKGEKATLKLTMELYGCHKDGSEKRVKLVSGACPISLHYLVDYVEDYLEEPFVCISFETHPVHWEYDFWRVKLALDKTESESESYYFGVLDFHFKVKYAKFM